MNRFKLIALSAMSAFIVYGCDPSDSGIGSLVVSEKTELIQTLYADSQNGNSKIIFYAAGPWTSRISEVTRADETNIEWISISPSEGTMEGDYNLVISVEPNFTGKSRTAKIDIICGDDGLITVEVTQTSNNEDGTPAVSLEDMIAESEELFSDAEAAFMQIDSQYASLESRQTVNASTAALYGFWEKSYAAIDCLNVLIERTEADMSAQEMDIIEYTAAIRRAVVYFYLNTLFGGVPLTADSDNPAEGLARSTAADVRDFIESELDAVITALPAAESLEPRLLKAKQAMTKGEYDNVAQITQAMINMEELVFADTNGDGLITADDSAALLAAHTYLLAAEAVLESGNTSTPIGYVNIVSTALGQQPVLAQGADAAQIRSAIRDTYNQWNKGVRFLNNIRWDSADWDKFALLPIPEKAMEENDKLTQNTGW